jgi:hypothetical protein
VRGIPGTVADRGVGKARVGAGPGAGGAGGIRGTRAGVRGRDGDYGLKGGNGAQLDSFENTHNLLGDLFGAKNAGVTNLPHLK